VANALQPLLHNLLQSVTPTALDAGVADGPIFNMSASNTSSFRSLVTGGSRSARVPVIADSTSTGVHDSGNTGVNAWPRKLAAKLQAAGRNAGSNNFFGVQNYFGGTVSQFFASDTRQVRAGANWQAQGVESAGGLVQGSAAADSLTFTPQDQVTDFIIYATQNSGHAPYNWSIDGGSTTGVVTAGTAGVSKTVITGLTKGVHALKIDWVSGTTRIIGVEAFDTSSGRKEISILHLGIYGKQSSDFIFDAGTPYTRRQMQKYLAGDLTLIEGGLVNDWLNASATTEANLTALAQDAKLTGIAVFITPPFDGAGTGGALNQQQYIDLMYKVAVAQNCPVWDIRKRFGWRSYNEANGMGYMLDQRHQTTLGHDDTAAFYTDCIQTLLTLS
jgi:hypothetical protein